VNDCAVTYYCAANCFVFMELNEQSITCAVTGVENVCLVVILVHSNTCSRRQFRGSNNQSLFSIKSENKNQRRPNRVASAS
jgi:hypothetical protein